MNDINWEKAYKELADRYQRLYQAAEDVWAAALPPQDGTGDRRQFVSTAALERLRKALYEE